ncbi:MAG: hypothetical protein IV100_15080 [Myxococcales bacterium]|nr:hypothetical protein [Myxococcales bacterium]
MKGGSGSWRRNGRSSGLALGAWLALGCEGGLGQSDAGMTAPTADTATGSQDSAGSDGADGSGDGVDGAEPTLTEVLKSTVDTGSTGEVTVTVPISSERSFMVLGTTETNARLAILAIDGPDGKRLLQWQDWTSATESLTNAFWATAPATVINWPIRAEDPPLVPGDYAVTIGSYKVDGLTPRPNVPVTVSALAKKDADLSAGLVKVVIVWAKGMADDDALVAATKDAVDHWEEVWAKAGMAIEVRYATSDLDPALPYPSAASGDVLAAASGLARESEIAVLIGETIDDDTSQYGVSGQIPGPLGVSPVSAIVIGWIANAGGDGEFSADDIRLYGEVLAHEVGHYVGLNHPVSKKYDYWDALTDTPECDTEEACKASLGTNLMYPVSICDGGTCLSTTVLTPGQQGIMHRYTGAL